MAEREFSIQPMQRSDLEIAISWAAAEGWNPGLQDGDSFYAADPTGFLMGWLGDEPIGCISAVKYGQSFGFIGFYIVQPNYRRQGFGIQLWQAAMAALQGRNIGLDGVLAQQENYRRSGFQLAYRNVRYAGVAGGEAASRADLVELTSLPLEQVVAYDRPFFPDDRRVFLQHWLQQSGSLALGILEQGQLVGYGVLRPCQTGYKIGPLFADRAELAEALFLGLRAQGNPGATLYLDIPIVNPAAIDLVNRYDMTMVFETARMYTHDRPVLPEKRIFGVTTFELG